MKKKAILMFFVFGLGLIANAQNAQDIIVGLKKDLQASPDDKKKATIYSDLTWYYSNISLDSAMHYGKKAIVESIKLKDSALISQVYSDVGAVYFRMNDFEKSKTSYLKALEIRKNTKDVAGVVKVKTNLANIYIKLGDRKSALANYLESIDFFEKANKLDIVAQTNANIGILFNDLKNYPKAISFLKRAISYQEQNNKQDGLCTSYLILGNALLYSKDTLKALNYFNKSIQISKKINNNVTLLAALNNIATIKLQQKKSAEALKLFDKSKVLQNTLNIEKDGTSYSLNIVKEKIMFSKFKEAKNLLSKLRQQYKNEVGSEENLLLTYQYLIHTYAYLNVPDSVNYFFNESEKLKDQIFGQNIIKQTADLEAKYQNAKKEKLIIAQKVEATKKNNFIIGLTALMFFLILFTYLVYRQQKLKNLQQSQAFELKQAINQIETQNKLQNQRLAISKDLHDNIGAQLTFIISSVETAKFAPELENTKIGNKLTQISSFTKDTINELRDTVWAMNSDDISFNDLQIRILNFIDKANLAAENVNFKFNIENALSSIKLTSVVGMNIYRTIQEAVNNSLKYAQASDIAINVKQIDAKIQIQIIDNGCGFEPQTIVLGNGLNNMQKRIEDIGGTLTINSELAKGTTVSVLIDK